MNNLRTLIIDDVPLARERVRLYLADEPDIAVVGEAANGREAVRTIASLAPDLVFLDVQMPDFDGFEVMKRIHHDLMPVIVFLTAHDEYALKAFEVNALDYLLKPFDRERFAQALNRARAQIRLRRGEKALEESPSYLQRLAVREKGRTDVVAMQDIDYIDVAGHYLCVHVGKHVHLIRGGIGDLEKQLDPKEFVRAHRSAIVRLDRIKSLSGKRNGDCDIVLVNGTVIPLSRTHRDAVRRRLGLPEF